MGRCGRERASCESVVAYRRWCPPFAPGGSSGLSHARTRPEAAFPDWSFPRQVDAEVDAKSLVRVVDAAPRQLPAPEAIARALDVLEKAERPLIILGKGAAYSQADADIRAFIERTGIPFLPMSMAKGLLPDGHPQSAAAARSFALAQVDVMMLIDARLN